jgi:hypothetical protein
MVEKARVSNRGAIRKKEVEYRCGGGLFYRPLLAYTRSLLAFSWELFYRA